MKTRKGILAVLLACVAPVINAQLYVGVSVGQAYFSDFSGFVA